MIIIRYKKARPLTTLILKAEKLHLPSVILYAKSVNVLFYEEGEIKNKICSNNRIQIYKIIGELERKDLPFILLIDKKCDIFHAKDFLTVINADCVKRDLLGGFIHGEIDPNEKNKSVLFDRM